MLHRRPLLALLALAALAALLFREPVFASVDLIYFKAEPTAGDTILLTWETATELDMIGFKVYRSEVESPDDWGTAIHSEGAQGNATTGYSYVYEDRDDVVAGVRYYYLLREVTNSGSEVDIETASAGVNLPDDTPTPTPTASATGSTGATPTSTRTATAARFVTLTPTAPRPTATRRFTDAPPTPTPGTPATPAPTAPPPVRPATSTPLPIARVATPTGLAPRVTLPAAPTLSPAVPTATLFAPVTANTPTKAIVAAAVQVETPTRLPTRELTPVVFSAEVEVGTSAAPEEVGQAPGQGSRSGALALVVGGSAIGLAGLFLAALLFLRSRRP